MQPRSGTKPTPARKALPRAEITARRLGHRLWVKPARGARKSRLPAEAELESPSSEMQKATPGPWSGGATRLRLGPVERDIPPLRLWRIRLSAAD